MEVSQTEEFDISLQEDNVFRRCRRLYASDMDSTLIETEVIDELLPTRAGVGPQVRAITPAPCAAKSTSASFRRRVALLEGLDERHARHREHLPITEG